MSGRKIDHAVEAAQKLVTKLHAGGDRCCIATFNNDFRVVQDFTTNEPTIHRSLDRIRSGCQGGTRLYDSMVDMVNHFRRQATTGRPWVLVVVTDGIDTDSKLSASSCGQQVYSLYNAAAANFVFAVGVGSGNEVDEDQLKRMGDAGRFSSMRIESFPLLEAVFLRLALSVTTELSGVRVTAGDESWALLQQQRRLCINPIDYAFLIDVSGSMTDKVSTVSDFYGHSLAPHSYGHSNWYCDRCGRDGTSSTSHHCSVCNFDACDRCTKDVTGKLESIMDCPKDHPLRYCMPDRAAWVCNGCKELKRPGRRLRCKHCDYDICENCFAQHAMRRLVLRALING